MQPDGNSFFARYWRLMLVGTVGVGFGAISTMATMSSQHEVHTPVQATGTPSNVATQEAQIVQATEYAPTYPDATERAPPDLDEGGTGPVHHVFNYGPGQAGWFPDAAGDCRFASGNSPELLAANAEGTMGQRLEGFDWFNDGIILNFRNGERRPLWLNLIDCKDPPYDPVKGEPKP